MSTVDTLIEGRIRDVPNLASQVTGTLYTKQIVQVQEAEEPIELQHSFYTRSVDGVNTKIGAIKWTESGISFDVLDTNTGTVDSVFEVTSNGISVNNGTASFGTAEVNVEDKDLVLGSSNTSLASLNGGGILLGRLLDDDSNPLLVGEDPISFIYNNVSEFWSTNIGLNVEPGHAFTIGVSDLLSSSPSVPLVSLDETGLTIAGATTPEDIVLSSSGLSVGEDLSLTTANGLTIAGTTSVDDITLSTSGLVVGSALSLTPSSGLVAGDIILNSTDGLEIGDELSLSSTNGLLFEAPAGDLTGDVRLDLEGIFIGNDISITKTGGLNVGSISGDSISFGISPDETTLDDTSLQLGQDILLNHDGLSLENEDAALFLGGKKWRIVFDSTTDNLKFQYDSTGGSGTYVTKAEMKST